MSKNLTTYAVGQMPKITGPNLLYLKVVSKLIAYRLNQAADPLAFAQLFRFQCGRLAILGRYGKLKSLLLKELRAQWHRKIGSVTQQYTTVALGQLRQHTDIMHIGSGHIERLDHAEGIDLNVQPKAIKSLVAKFLSVRCNALKKLARSGSCEPTHRDGKTVDDGNDVFESFAEMFKQSLLNYPEICRLTNETDPAGESGKVMTVEVSEKSEDVFVGIETEDFADDFHCKYFAVSHLRRRASLSQGSFWKEFFHKIISFTEDIYDKIIKVHFFALHGQWNNVLVYL